MVLRKYNDAGYQVKKSYCEREFKKIIDEVKDKLGVEMNYTGTDEYVPETERNN